MTLIRRGVALHINVDFHFSDFYLMALRETSQLKRFLIFVKDNVSFPYLSKKKKKKEGVEKITSVSGTQHVVSTLVLSVLFPPYQHTHNPAANCLS